MLGIAIWPYGTHVHSMFERNLSRFNESREYLHHRNHFCSNLNFSFLIFGMWKQYFTFLRLPSYTDKDSSHLSPLLQAHLSHPHPHCNPCITGVYRVVHGYGPHCGFCCVGVVGTGMVSDFPTCTNTTPIAGYLQVSATHSHAHTGLSCIAFRTLQQ